MGRIIVVILVLLTLLALLGIALPAVMRARAEAEFRRCQDNLRRIGFGMLHAVEPGATVPEKARDRVPPGTIVNGDMSFDQRLSWYVMVAPAIEQGIPNGGGPPRAATALDDALASVNTKLAWDAPPHKALAAMQLKFARCPAWPGVPNAEFGLTNYPGNGGLGQETPAKSIDDAGHSAGAFRYDTPTPFSVIGMGDGLEQTLLVGETSTDLGPWLRGGPATVRTLNADTSVPYLGKGRLYSGNHPGRGNFLFADGSVRVLTDRTNGDFFKGLLTIDGRDTDTDFTKE